MDESIQVNAPLPDESWNPPVLQPEKPSDSPTIADESKIPEGKDPQVFDQTTGMNMPKSFEESISEV